MAIKGKSASEEIERDARQIQKAGGGRAEVLLCGAKKLTTPVFTVPATVVRIKRTR
ncbi:hypothetical protein GCM10029992_11940 [Glycomyces albus]